MASFPYHVRAAEEQAARKRVNETAAAFRCERTAEAEQRWRDALAAWYASIWKVAPLGLGAALAALRQGEHSGMDLVLGFLEADPVFFRSGYMKERALRVLKRVTLTSDEARRLRAITVAALRGPTRREFRDHCRLAAVLVDTTPGGAALKAEVAALAVGSDTGTARRARWMLVAIDARRSLR